MSLQIERTVTQEWSDPYLSEHVPGTSYSRRENKNHQTEYAHYNGVADRYVGPESKELESALRRYWFDNAPLLENEARHPTHPGARYRVFIEDGRFYYRVRTSGSSFWSSNLIPFNDGARELFRRWIDASPGRLAIEAKQFPEPKLYSEKELQEHIAAEVKKRPTVRISEEDLRNATGGIVELFNGRVANASEDGEPGVFKTIGDVVDAYEELLLLSNRLLRENTELTRRVREQKARINETYGKFASPTTPANPFGAPLPLLSRTNLEAKQTLRPCFADIFYDRQEDGSFRAKKPEPLYEHIPGRSLAPTPTPDEQVAKTSAEVPSQTITNEQIDRALEEGRKASLAYLAGVRRSYNPRGES